MRRGLVSVVACTVLLLNLMPSVAQASGEVGLSRDGTAWSESLIEPLFDPALRWVPGDAGSTSFFVRNQADSGATLTIAVVTQDDDGLLRRRDINLSARVGTQAWVDLDRMDGNFPLTDDALPQGESRKVEVKAMFDPASPNRSQRNHLALTFRVTLSDDQSSSAAPEAGEGGDESTAPTAPSDKHESDGSLPNSGAPPVGWFIVAAGVAIGSGLTLLTRRKRKDTWHDPAH